MPKLSKKKSNGKVAGGARRSTRSARISPPSQDDAQADASSVPGHSGGSSASERLGEFETMGTPWPLVTPPDSRAEPLRLSQQLPPLGLSASPAPPTPGLPVGADTTYPMQPAMLSCVCDELGGEVPGTIKDKIWKGEFFELGRLLKRDSEARDDSGFQALSLCSSDSGSYLTLRPQSKAPIITSIEQWTSAFLIFASIYLERHCMRARELLKYMDIIRSIVRFGAYNWRTYDTQFRLRQARHPHRSWAVIDTELWLTVAASPRPAGLPDYTRSQPFRPYERTPRGGSFPTSEQLVRQPAVPGSGSGPSDPRFQKPVCFAFNAGSCGRSSCRYAHRCESCASTSHGANACNATASGRAPNTHHTSVAI